MKSPKTKSSPALVKPSPTAVRGKYFNQLQRGTNVIILDPALMPYFPDSESVNRALHAFWLSEIAFIPPLHPVVAGGLRPVAQIQDLILAKALQTTL